MSLSSFIFIALAGLVTAQSADPVLNSTNNPFLPFRVSSHHSAGLGIVPQHAPPDVPAYVWTPIVPLSEQASKDIHLHPLKLIPGYLRLNTVSTSKNLLPNDVAVTSCDPDDYLGEISLPDVINDAIHTRVSALVFYTHQNQSYCNVSDHHSYGNFTQIFTLYNPPHNTNFTNVSTVIDLAGAKPPARAGTCTFDGLQNALTNDPGPNYGGTGSTAVAMIILYSITGVITALFLVIIVSGAIRAHRHPERYGPRNSLGRTRQSRAKGIARAMLDTIPIVKFGENRQEPDKDVESHELENRASQSPTGVRHENIQANNSPSGAGATATTTNEENLKSDEATSAQEQPIADSSATNSTTQPDETTEESLGCSICTDDFQIGQDIRVLPCDHKFHPACVDPWLLEVSGTCPLCRVDLHPQSQDTENQDTDDLPPPLGGPLDSDNTGANAGGSNRRRNTLRAFVSSRLNRRTLQGTSAEERIEVLRRWREANAVNNTTSSSQRQASSASPTADDNESSRNGRLSAFSRLIRRRER